MFGSSAYIGKALAGARYREGLTQIELSELTGIPQRHISEMENGKCPIGKEMAKRLGKTLNIGYKVSNAFTVRRKGSLCPPVSIFGSYRDAENKHSFSW